MKRFNGLNAFKVLNSGFVNEANGFVVGTSGFDIKLNGFIPILYGYAGEATAPHANYNILL